MSLDRAGLGVLGRWARGFVALVALVAPSWAAPALASTASPELFQRGVEAYRRGAYGEARTLWLEVLEAELPDAERARVLYDLGNASWRLGDQGEAVGWYTAAVRLAPRDGDAWHNLELARSETGLEPADRGDLDATVRRVLGSLTPPEARRLALGAVLLLAVVLLLEALRGGRLLGALSLLAFLGTALACAPWAFRLTSHEADPVLVIRPGGAELRSEPRAALPQVASAEAGSVVERIDAVPGWVRVEVPGGARGWTPEEAVFELDR